jgi:TusA-related sulfurtransferase
MILVNQMPSGRVSKILIRDVTTVRTLKSFIQGQEGIAVAEQVTLSPF